MTCLKIQQELAAYLIGESSPAQKAEIAHHLAGCGDCSTEFEQMRASWQALDHWQEQPLPAGLALSISAQARAAAANASIEPAAQKASPWWQQSFVPLSLGLAAAIVSAAIIASRSSIELIHPLGLIAAGAVWVVLYGLVFSLFSIGRRSGQASWQFLAQAALVAGGMFLLLTYVSPVPSSITFCSKYYLTQPFLERLSIGGSYFLFGGLYALIPMGLAAFFSVNRREKNPLLHGSLAGGMFAIMLAPSIFMQCAPFVLGVLLGWFGGALVGSVVGGAIGYWIRYKLV